jgi:peptidoglycan hydrolase CwlO-like protein
MKQAPKNIAAVILVSAITLSLVSPWSVFSQTREALEDELKKIEEQIAGYEKELATAKTEKQTLANKINQLKKEQEKISLQIKSTNLQVNELGKQLSSAENSIQNTTQKLNNLKKQTAGILRSIYEQSQKSLAEILLGERGLSAFFARVAALEKLSENLSETASEVKVAKSELEVQYTDLATKQADKKNLLAIQTLQRQGLLSKTNEQNKLLKDTQGKEAKYQASLADSKKRAQEIRSRIYELLGVSAQITFGEAAAIAQWTEKMTGVRAALLLAVLTQESNLGKNVGQCALIDTTTGRLRSINTRVVFTNGIHPTRDLPLFLAVADALGKDPLATAVSCPLAGVPGYGGAMGPAQFIPSTWMLYKNKIPAITGKNPASPWDIKDAFVAAALLLKDNGATSGRSDAEWRAAMLYFSGSTNTKFRFYGDNVVALANKYAEDIRALG